MLSVGGLLFVAGSIGFATVQLQVYEDRIAYLEGVLVPAGVSPAEAAVEAAPAEPVVEATPTRAENDPASAADLRIAELETRLVQLGEELGIARDNLAGAQETIDSLNVQLDACRQAGSDDSRLRELNQENVRLRRENAQLRRTCAAANPDVIG